MLLGEDIGYVARTYDQFRRWKQDVFLEGLKQNIDSRLEPVGKRFSAMYQYAEKADKYSFRLRVTGDHMVFCIFKNNEPAILDLQSTGFQKFFHLFFNFLHRDDISRGDIVLIDEPENSLSIPVQRELRSFLKDFGRKHGITFIISTHSPFMLSMDHLDEVRMVVKNSKAKGSWIVNDFSTLDSREADTLKNICEHLGISKPNLADERVVFVEGIMDYNIFGACQRIHSGGKSKFTFLPIGGLGKQEGGGEPFNKERQEKIQKLCDLAKDLGICEPLLLVDADEAGMAVQKGAKEQSAKDNPECRVHVITLKDVSAKNTTLESLFSQEDRDKFGLTDCKKLNMAAVVSSALKNDPELKEKLSPETKKNFGALFGFLEKFWDEEIR